MNGLEKLDIKHFKFFSDTKELDFTNQNAQVQNILIYGENGSGKSTIFWALYTFLQTSLKDKHKIQEYFSDIDNPKSLVNIFQDDISKSYIRIYVKNNENISQNISQNFAISKGQIDSYKGLEDNIIKDVNLTSDFINYKYIFRFFNFLNRDTIDLFELFRYEIFHFEIDNICLKDLLDEIESIDNKYISEGTYEDKLRELNSFNSNLQSIISKLDLPTNQYIKKFALNTIKISFSSIGASYEELDKQVKGNSYKYKFNLPQINISIFQKKGTDWTPNPIPKPQSFFNEAKLTAIALSVRLAITQIKLKNSPLKLLVLDDLLVSLDMSNRDKVLDILLNDEVLKEYQKIILTHDKAFFEMAKQKFNYVEKGKWKYFEMYLDDSGDFEKPLINDESLTYLEKAEGYFKLCDYPVSGNYLRKASEEIIKSKLLETFKANEKDGLDRTIQNYESMCKEFKIPITKNIQWLKELTQRVFNPSSHDDIVSPLYKKEINYAINLVKKLKELPQIEILETSIKKESLLRFKYEEKYEIVYIFLADIKLYTYKGDILNRDSILLSKSMHKVLVSGEWKECCKINNKFLSLEKIFKIMKHFIKKEFKYDLDIENFIDNLTLDKKVLNNTIKKLVHRQCQNESTS